MRLLRWPVPVHIHFEWPKFVQRMLVRTIRPVVVESVCLNHLVESKDGEPDSLVAVLEFNGEQAEINDLEYVDLLHLRSSLDENGTFFIWTCSCGAPGCAGLFEGVRVTHSDGVTSWEDLDGKRAFVFRSQDLRDAYARGIIIGRNLLTARATLAPTPEQNARAYQADG